MRPSQRLPIERPQAGLSSGQPGGRNHPPRLRSCLRHLAVSVEDRPGRGRPQRWPSAREWLEPIRRSPTSVHPRQPEAPSRGDEIQTPAGRAEPEAKAGGHHFCAVASTRPHTGEVFTYLPFWVSHPMDRCKPHSYAAPLPVGRNTPHGAVTCGSQRLPASGAPLPLTPEARGFHFHRPILGT